MNIDLFLQLSDAELALIENVELSIGALNEWPVICSFLAKCKNMKRLELCANQLSRLSIDQWQALKLALSQCKLLENVGVGNSDIYKMSPEQLNALGAVLGQCQSLKSFGFGMNGLCSLTDQQWQSLVEIAPWGNLQSLTLSYNNVGKLGPKAWDAFLNILENGKNLQDLHLEKSALNFSAARWNEFVNSLAALPKLKYLDINSSIDYAKMSDESFEIFCSIFTKCEMLQTICLGQSNLHALSVSKLAILAASLENSPIQKIDLRCGALALFKDIQWAELGNALLKAKLLQEVDLRENDFLGMSIQENSLRRGLNKNNKFNLVLGNYPRARLSF